MDIRFDGEKDRLLLEQRGVCFHDAIRALEGAGAVLDIPHPAQERYTNQRIFGVAIDGYAYCVPYVVDGDTWILRTVFPNRKFKCSIEEGDRGQV